MSTHSLSVIVIVYNIPREAPRTLYSLSAAYQRHVSADDYEVIVVDNGSSPPVDPALVAGFGSNFRLLRIDDASPSPAQAINRGIAAARSEVIGVLIDGARLVTPGMAFFALQGARLYHRAVVTTLGWYLGADFQGVAMRAGYDKPREDALLDSIPWREDGYRLFDIATLDESSIDGWLQPVAESNALFLNRETWRALGGVDEGFAQPGGGLVNLDTYRRAIELPGAEIVILLSEGTFHQLHGGVATNTPAEEFAARWAKWSGEYEALRGVPWSYGRNPNKPTYLGKLPRAALVRLARAAVEPVARGRDELPLGNTFSHDLWSLTPVQRAVDPRLARVIALAHAEFHGRRFETAAAVARIARAHAPDEHEPQRLLSLIGAWLPPEAPPSAHTHALVGRAERILAGELHAGESEKAMLAVTAYGPTESVAGAAFNAQPSGQSALWMQLETAPDYLVQLTFGGETLITQQNGATLTAEIPTDLLASPRALEIVVVDGGGQRITVPVPFTIRAR